jgi:hypothetical protein
MKFNGLNIVGGKFNGLNIVGGKFNGENILIGESPAPSYTNLASFAACEETTGWTAFRVQSTIDSENEFEGTNCIKIAIDPTRSSGYIYKNVYSVLDKTKYYLFSGYVKNGNASNGISISIDTNDEDVYGSAISDTTYTRTGVLLQPSNFADASFVYFQVRIIGAENQYAYVDACMVNEITAEDYAAGVEACLAKYPYKAP